MLRLRIISFFLCLLMTVQMLPIEQIGAMLSQNVWTEELPHNLGDSGKSEANANATPFLPPAYNHYTSDLAESMARAYLHTSANIPSNHSTDVVYPPPDFIC